MSYHTLYINVNVLEEDPSQFLEHLKHCVDNNIDVIDELSNTEQYETWYSSCLHCLFYLVGDLQSVDANDFYGHRAAISEQMGMDILHYMDRAGVDYNVKNYYDMSVYQCILDFEKGNKCLSDRENNTNFINFLKVKCEERLGDEIFTDSHDAREYNRLLGIDSMDFLELTKHTC